MNKYNESALKYVYKTMKTLVFYLTAYGSVAQKQFSGVYDSMKLGYDPQSKQLSGYFKEIEVEDSKILKKCEFYLKGTYDDAKKESMVTIYTNDYQLLTHGYFDNNSLRKEADIILFRLEKNIQQCQSMMPTILTKSGIVVSKKWELNWKGIRLIKNTKVYFYKSPKESDKSKTYVLKGDFVGIIETKGSWLKAEYMTTKNKVVGGWLKKTDIFAQ